MTSFVTSVVRPITRVLRIGFAFENLQAPYRFLLAGDIPDGGGEDVVFSSSDEEEGPPTPEEIPPGSSSPVNVSYAYVT